MGSLVSAQPQVEFRQWSAATSAVKQHVTWGTAVKADNASKHFALYLIGTYTCIYTFSIVATIYVFLSYGISTKRIATSISHLVENFPWIEATLQFSGQSVLQTTKFKNSDDMPIYVQTLTKEKQKDYTTLKVLVNLFRIFTSQVK